MRTAFVSACENMLKFDENSVILLGDIGVHSFQKLKTNFPSRIMNLGILEQSMVGVGAGFASRGVIPTLHTIAPFLIERALEQIKVDFGYQSLPGNFVSVGASFDYSSLGCTHHCPADIEILSNVPGVDLFIPGHEDEFLDFFQNNWNSGSINYFRLSSIVNASPNQVSKGETKRIKGGHAAVVVAVGPILDAAIEGLAELDVELHYVSSILHSKELSFHSQLRNVPFITIEPYYPGRVLAKSLSHLSSLSLKPYTLGVTREFSRDYGTLNDHLRINHLDSKSINRQISRLI
jgi:transketolase